MQTHTFMLDMIVTMTPV